MTELVTNSAGFQQGTITRAKALLGIESTKVGDRWYWSIPTRNQEVNKSSVRSSDDSSNIDFDDFYGVQRGTLWPTALCSAQELKVS